MNFKHLFPVFRARYLFVERALERLAADGASLQRGLSLGTGEGDYDARLAEACGHVVACDINEADIRHARAANAEASGLSYCVADAHGLGLPDAAFDVITCVDVLEHVARPADVLREIARLLAPSGSALVTVPHHEFPLTYDPLNVLARPFREPFALGAYGYGHHFLFRDADLRKLVADAGLVVAHNEHLSRYFAGLVECYWPGLAQKLLKANAGNRDETQSGVTLRPRGGPPALAALTDLGIAIDDGIFAWSRRSVGLAYVLRRSEA